MCVICYKPKGLLLPSRNDLKQCFKTNPDGAGYMFPYDNKVIIHKGFMTYDELEKDLNDTFKSLGLKDVKNIPIVLHFRISTQGGVNKALCHPFAVCNSYEEMRLLKHKCDIGLAHNGIISLTSSYGGHYDYKTMSWQSNKDLSYNDTMTFILKYANLIINHDDYFARNTNKITLIKELIGSSNKLAIMNKRGFVKLIGDFYLHKGCYYSNLNAFALAKNDINTKVFNKYWEKYHGGAN